MNSPCAEIICVGTELLLGEVLNSNAQYLAQQLARLGISHFFQTVVGDNTVRLKQAIAIACQRSSLILLTGGLGPTPDDLTTATLADFFDVPLEERAEVWQDIQAKFKGRELPVSSNNRRQAFFPVGAAVLPNPVGSAPGLIWQPHPDLTLMTFPGVPLELYAMWEATAVPYCHQQGWVSGQIYSRMLRFWGVSESGLAEKVARFLSLTHPVVAPYASRGQVRLRVSVRAGSARAAAAVLDPVVSEIRALCGPDCFGLDEDSLASVVGQLLRDRQQTLAVAESCTGGGLGQRLTEIPGSSDYFLGGVIAYDNRVKETLLQVDSDLLETEGAVSGSVAEQMAIGVQSCLGTSWGISITGIAGPGGGTPTKPVGLVYIGIASPDGQVFHVPYQAGSTRGRESIRDVSASTALDLLRRQLLQQQ